MAFKWKSGWDSQNNHNGTKQDYVVTVLRTANNMWIDGDQGIKECLAGESDEIEIVKGIHQDSDLHVTIEYRGEHYHVNVREGANGQRVSGISKRPFGRK